MGFLIVSADNYNATPILGMAQWIATIPTNSKCIITLNTILINNNHVITFATSSSSIGSFPM